jgi:hypothetical protein
MRFEFYNESLIDVPKLSVDGIVPNSVHFSHWKGNETDNSIYADTSTGTALNLVAALNRDEMTKGIELVTNNHFDTDGVLSVWTVLNGEHALDFKELLIAAATAGDFSEFTNEQAVRVSLTIQGSDNPISDEDTGSPLARHLAGRPVDDDAESYALVLPEVENLLRNTNDYEPLWRDAWDRIETALNSFAKGASSVVEDEETKLSVVTLAPEVFSPNGFNPTRHAAPYTAISRYAHGQLFLIATQAQNGWYYRVDYPYYSWAETIVRPRIVRKDFSELIAGLNEIEKSEGEWKKNESGLSSAFHFVDANDALAASSLTPDVVADKIRALPIADCRFDSRFKIKD